MYNKKRIMTRAHIFHSSRPDHTFGAMLYYAWRSFDIRNFIGFVKPLRDTAIPGERDAG